jgi:hypothetical protein
MEDIPKFSLKMLQKKNEEKYLPQERELQAVEELRKREAIEEKKKKIRELSSQAGIQIQTKIAKGPNPLSAKKKKMKLPSHPQKHTENSSQGMPPKRKRIRKRNQAPQSSKPVHGGNDANRKY